MKRKFRLTKPTDFQRVRRNGKSYAHPLIVLIVLPNENDQTRFGIAAGRAVGNAVVRNRAKRLMREALRPMIPSIIPGWDIVLIARSKMPGATQAQTRRALDQLFRRANLLIKTAENERVI